MARQIITTTNLPSVYCNTCDFFQTWVPSPESCTGFGAFRKYQCDYLNIDLKPDWKKIHKKAKDMFDSDEHKVEITKECLKKFPP